MGPIAGPTKAARL